MRDFLTLFCYKIYGSLIVFYFTMWTYSLNRSFVFYLKKRMDMMECFIHLIHGIPIWVSQAI